MAFDLQCVFPSEVIRITKVSSVPGSSPAMLRVEGEDFSAVGIVEVNERESPSWFVESRTVMRLVLPGGVQAADVWSVTVTSRRLVLSSKSLLRFQLTRTPGKVSGTLKLTQNFIKVLFTEPGRDIFHKDYGAAALKNLGNTFSKDQSSAILSDFAIAVKSAQKQLIALQSRQVNLPPDEKLLNAKLTSSTFSVAESALLVTIELTSQTGVPAIVNITV